MKSYTKENIKKALVGAKIKKGDSVFLTTSIGMLGYPSTNKKNLPLVTSEWILREF